MITINFNAFSFLQARLKEKQTPYVNAPMKLPGGMSVDDLVRHVGLAKEDVEGAFVNGRIVPTDTLLKDGDRVALVPQGTPGPYRVMLGMVPLKKKKDPIGRTVR